jgi:adhesin transport system outer membrane protein
MVFLLHSQTFQASETATLTAMFHLLTIFSQALRAAPRLVVGASLAASLFSAVAATAVPALPAAQTSPVDLNAVLREAVTQHPDVRSRRDDQQAAVDRLDAARWGRFPGLSAEVETRSGGPQSVMRVEQPLWNGGRISSQIGVSQAELNVAGATLSETQLDVLQRSAGAFFDILRLESRLKTALANEAEHLRLVEIIQRRVAAEVSPSTDETQAAARWRQAITERIQTIRQIDTARLLLAQLMGKTVTDLWPPMAVSMTRWDETTLLEAAMRVSPERQRLVAQVEAAEAQINLAKSQIMPSLVAGYQSRLGTLPFGEERNRAYMAVQVQTGGGLSYLANVRAAVSKKTAAVDAIEAHDRRLTQSVRTSWAESLALTEQVEPVRKLLTGSEEIVASYLRQFQVGRKNWLDVLNAQREKTQASYSFSDLEYPLMLSSVRLLLLAGRWDPATLSLSHAP